MPHTEQPHHPAEHPQDHEHSDVNVRGIAIAFAAIVVVAVVTHVGLYFLFDAFEVEERAARQPRSAIRTGAVRIPETTPRLQGIPGFHEDTPVEDTEQMLLEHRRRLGSYGPAGVDGFVRVPIDRAMELALQRELFPTQPPPRDAEEGGTRAPGSP